MLDSEPKVNPMSHRLSRRRFLQVAGVGGLLGVTNATISELAVPGSTVAGRDLSAVAEVVDNAVYKSVTEAIPVEEVQKNFYTVPLEPVNLMPADASVATKLQQNYRCFVCRENNNYPPIPSWEKFTSLFKPEEIDEFKAKATEYYKGNTENLEAKTVKVYLDSLIKQGVIKIAYQDESSGNYIANKPDNWLTNFKPDLYTFGAFQNVIDVDSEGKIKELWLDTKSKRKDCAEIVEKAGIKNEKVLCMSMHTSLSAFNDIAQGLNPEKDVTEWTERKWHLMYDQRNEQIKKLFFDSTN
jgi:hypothetical protein